MGSHRLTSPSTGSGQSPAQRTSHRAAPRFVWIASASLALFFIALLSENLLPDLGWPGVPVESAAEVKILAATTAAITTFWYYLGPALALGSFAFWAGFAWLAEGLAMHTGWPAGHYSYSSAFPGPQIWDTPVLLGFQYYCYYFFISYFVSNLIVDTQPTSRPGNRWTRHLFVALIASLIVAGIDMMADPVQVHFAGQWSWPATTPHLGYFGIPLANYLGYIVIFTVALFVFKLIEGRPRGVVMPTASTPWLVLIPLLLYVGRYFAYADVAPDGVPLVGLFTMLMPFLIALDRLRLFARVGAQQDQDSHP